MNATDGPTGAGDQFEPGTRDRTRALEGPRPECGLSGAADLAALP